ncbi:hypothetical protein [Arenicella xantha]|uniref:Uncharacterized protein n=2 Tax=Arenicella TaxID=904708 RepID=A0A395JEQ9_9GAMM|nr:hypothetical protein [Arenicella xantha]RBP47022.1 hypothetical protein DFR28_1126 [Arenicella xantha]GHA14763.1 hypothetical protein GCM10008090_25710 [Arenicella chitinivorans]
MNNSLENFIWHDGNIESLNYSVAKTGVSLVIEGEFYSSSESKQRDKYLITCDNVTRFNNMADFEEILDNLSAGSVSNGYLKENKLWLYLSDGVIEIHAKNINVSKH